MLSLNDARWRYGEARETRLNDTSRAGITLYPFRFYTGGFLTLALLTSGPVRNDRMLSSSFTF